MPKDNHAKTASEPKPLVWLGICLVLIIAVFANSLIKRPVTCSEEYVSKNYRNDVSIQINGQEFKTEVASTVSKQELGLSGRNCITPDRAMLFTFDTGDTSEHCFWMKDMKFAIDIVWLDENHKVVFIEKSVQPNTYPAKQFCPKQHTNFVLELASGRADELRLDTDSFIKF